MPPASLIEAWLRGRSLARGLPAPVLDRGGYRIDTGAPDEVARYVFGAVCDGLRALGREIGGSGYPLKLFGPAADLAAALWRVDGSASFMIECECVAKTVLPTGYRLERHRAGEVVRLRVLAGDGTVAASCYAADTAQAFVCDRVVTVEAHRRRGLATALMLALARERRHPGSPGLLVATASGAEVYRRIGWRTFSPYATALHAAGQAWSSPSIH